MNRCIFGPRATPTHAIALRGVRLRSRLSGMSQRTTIEQTYVNLEREAIEAAYTFPLPESAAVCGFEVVTGDRVLTGEVEEIEEAVGRYEEAVNEGHGAFLAEQNRPDVFTVRVGNLLPRQAVTVRLTYVCPLERADRAIRVAFPTTIAPRYATATGTDPLDAQIDADALNPPHVLTVPYGLTMEVEVELGRSIRRVTSPSHRISTSSRNETHAAVTLAGGVTEMDRDVVLSIELEREHEPVVQVAAGKQGECYLAVSFVPEFEVDELLDAEPTETVFVLDCSGSMQGESIGQAVAALELCLRSLAPGDTFNVCRFGSTFDLMSSEPLHYSQQTLDRALSYVRQGADLGGTELYAALHAVMTPSPRVGRRRQVVVLTDGQVTNEPALLELARNLRPRNRVFSFSIGSAASASLVKGLARATGGAAEFITAGERIDDKVLRTFGRLTSPFVEDVSIDWGGCDVQTLAEIPPVFDGDVMTVFGRAPGELPWAVTLSCRAPSGQKRWSVAVPPSAEDGGVIATMWARRTIQSLEEVNHLNQGRYRKGEATREAETVIRLSKEFGLLSSLTAFVAVEHRLAEERDEGMPALRRIPVALARSWGGVDTARLVAQSFLHADAAARCVSAAPRYSVRRRSAARQRAEMPPAAMAAPAIVSLDRSLDEAMGSSAIGGGDGDPIQAPIIKLVEAVISEAVRAGASGIHFESHADRLGVSYRIDGKLVERDRIPLRMASAVVARLKVMANLDPAAKGLPQQGEFQFRMDDVPVDFEVSVRAGANGPCVDLTVRGFESVRHAASLRAVLGLQSADGWFGWDRSRADSDPVDAALRRFGHDPAIRFQAARRLVPTMTRSASDADRAARSLLVLALLQDHFHAEHPLWRRAALKAIRFLQQALQRDAAEMKALIQSLPGRSDAGLVTGAHRPRWGEEAGL